MELGDLGEFALIERIKRATARRGGSGPAVVLGMGDDAALLRLRREEVLAVSTDAAVADVHFRMHIETPASIGLRGLAAALSDLAAMGARPLGVVIALAAPPTTPVSWVDKWLAGLLRGAERWGAPLVGGNLTRARELAFTTTVHGALHKDHVLRRNAARPGDRLMVTGVLGRAALDYARAEAGLGKRRHIPSPRLEVGRRLASFASVGACIDLSDGLRADLLHVTEASGVGATLELESIPRPRGFKKACEGLSLDPTETLLAGGEDYELLFSVRAKGPDSKRLSARMGLPVSEVGRVIEGRGVSAPKVSGFKHF